MIWNIFHVIGTLLGESTGAIRSFDVIFDVRLNKWLKNNRVETVIWDAIDTHVTSL